MCSNNYLVGLKILAFVYFYKLYFSNNCQLTSKISEILDVFYFIL